MMDDDEDTAVIITEDDTFLAEAPTVPIAPMTMQETIDSGPVPTSERPTARMRPLTRPFGSRIGRAVVTVGK